MTYRLFMTIAAVIALVFGLLFALIPNQLMGRYGVGLGETGLWVARYLGSAYIGVGFVTLLARNSPNSEARRAILRGMLAMSVTGLVVAVLHGFMRQGNALVWLNVVIFLFLLVGNGYFVFVKPDAV
jgi:hypothetical protein